MALNELLQDDTSSWVARKNNDLEANSQDDVILEFKIKEIYKLKGALAHAGLIDNFNKVVIYSQLAAVQRAYRRGDSPELHRYAPTFPAFCEMMGLNYNSVREHLNTLHVLGQEFFAKAEEIGIPVREMRILKKLPTRQRDKLIEAVTSGEVSSDYVKEAIKELANDNVRMAAMLETVSTKEKAELEIEVERRDTEIELLKSYLSKEQDKSSKYQERVKELLASQKPESRMLAIESLTKKIDGILQAIDGADMGSDDPVFRAKKDELRAYITRIQEILG